MYRIDFGNGQAHNSGSLAQAKRDLALAGAFAYIQRHYPGSADEPGYWARVRGVR